jgi:hypothetical protein
MNILQRHARVRIAQARMTEARISLERSASTLLARSCAHPLSSLGVAAGAGFVLGRLDLHPLRVPALGSLLGGGIAEAIAQGVRVFADMSGADDAA